MLGRLAASPWGEVMKAHGDPNENTNTACMSLLYALGTEPSCDVMKDLETVAKATAGQRKITSDFFLLCHLFVKGSIYWLCT